MSITKATLSEHLYFDLGFNRQEAKTFVDSFFEQMCIPLESNEFVKLSGFGSFELRDKKPRPGRNPKTSKQVTISARRVVTFKSSQKFKHLINKNNIEI